MSEAIGQAIVAGAGAVSTIIGGAGTAAGFGSGGIVGGSIAAAIQSTIGNISAGSMFAVLQSFGMIGGFVGLFFMGLGVLCDTLIANMGKAGRVCSCFVFTATTEFIEKRSRPNLPVDRLTCSRTIF
jgi:hypothetical protein